MDAGMVGRLGSEGVMFAPLTDGTDKHGAPDRAGAKARNRSRFPKGRTERKATADPYGMTTRNAKAKAESKVAETDGVWGHLR